MHTNPSKGSLLPQHVVAESDAFSTFFLCTDFLCGSILLRSFLFVFDAYEVLFHPHVPFILHVSFLRVISHTTRRKGPCNLTVFSALPVGKHHPCKRCGARGRVPACFRKRVTLARAPSLDRKASIIFIIILIRMLSLHLFEASACTHECTPLESDRIS